MIEPDHQAIMVKADLDGAGSDVRLVYHLLGEGKDLAELLRSGQATPIAANGEPALSLALSSCLVPSPVILPCPQPCHHALSPALSSCLVPSPFILPCPQPFHRVLSPVLSCLVPSPVIMPCPQSFHVALSPALSSCLVPSPFILPCPQPCHHALSPVLSCCLVPSPFMLPCPQSLSSLFLSPDQFFPPPSVDSLNTYGEGSDGTRDTERVPFSLVIDGKSFELVRTHCAEILKKVCCN